MIAGVWITGGIGGRDGVTAAPGVTPESTAEPEGPRARVALTSNLYDAPARTAELVAIVPEGRAVRVTGRTDDSTWIRVIYPVTSTLEGWLPASNLIEDSVPDLAAVPDVASVGGGGATAGEPGLVEETALPDLTVSSADVAGSGVLTVRVTNIGRTGFSGSVGLRILTAEGEIVGALEVGPVELPGGRSASVNTGVVVTETGLFIIEVDPTNEIEESSEFNNSRRVLLVGTGS